MAKAVAMDRRHQFVLRRPGLLRLLPKQVSGEAFVDCRYELEIDGNVQKGKIDATGVVAATAPRRAKQAELRIWELEGDEELPDPHVWTITIGKMLPVNDVTGVQQRLENLGFDIGDDPLGTEGSGTRAAVRAFEEWVGLKSAAEEFRTTGDVTLESPISDAVRKALDKLSQAPPGLIHGGPLPTRGDLTLEEP